MCLHLQTLIRPHHMTSVQAACRQWRVLHAGNTMPTKYPAVMNAMQIALSNDCEEMCTRIITHLLRPRVGGWMATYCLVRNLNTILMSKAAKMGNWELRCIYNNVLHVRGRPQCKYRNFGVKVSSPYRITAIGLFLSAITNSILTHVTQRSSSFIIAYSLTSYVMWHRMTRSLGRAIYGGNARVKLLSRCER